MKFNKNLNKFHKNYLKSNVILKPKKKNIFFKGGFFGLMLNKSCKLTKSNIESIRKILSRLFKLKGIYFKINKPKLVYTIYKKSKKSRMGKGKGKFTGNLYVLKKNYIICELFKPNSSIDNSSYNLILKKIGFKLPGTFKIIQY